MGSTGNQEVEYFGKGHAAFIASKKGFVDQMYWKDRAGHQMPVKIQTVQCQSQIHGGASQAARRKRVSKNISRVAQLGIRHHRIKEGRRNLRSLSFIILFFSSG